VKQYFRGVKESDGSWDAVWGFSGDSGVFPPQGSIKVDLERLPPGYGQFESIDDWYQHMDKGGYYDKTPNMGTSYVGYKMVKKARKKMGKDIFQKMVRVVPFISQRDMAKSRRFRYLGASTHDCDIWYDKTEKDEVYRCDSLEGLGVSKGYQKAIAGAGIAIFLLFAMPLVFFRVRAYRRSKQKKDIESSTKSEQGVKTSHENADNEFTIPASTTDKCLVDDTTSLDDSLAKNAREDHNMNTVLKKIK